MVVKKKVEPNFDLSLNTEAVIKKKGKIFMFINLIIFKSTYFKD